MPGLNIYIYIYIYIYKLITIYNFLASRNASDWWLAYWISHSQSSNNQTIYYQWLASSSKENEKSNNANFYLMVYGIIGASNTVSNQLTKSLVRIFRKRLLFEIGRFYKSFCNVYVQVNKTDQLDEIKIH